MDIAAKCEGEIGIGEVGLDDGVPEESVTGVGRHNNREDTSREIGATEGRIEGDELGSEEGVGRVTRGDDDCMAAKDGAKVGGRGGEEKVKGGGRGRGKRKRGKAD